MRTTTFTGIHSLESSTSDAQACSGTMLFYRIPNRAYFPSCSLISNRISFECIYDVIHHQANLSGIPQKLPVKSSLTTGEKVASGNTYHSGNKQGLERVSNDVNVIRGVPCKKSRESIRDNSCGMIQWACHQLVWQCRKSAAPSAYIRRMLHRHVRMHSRPTA